MTISFKVRGRFPGSKLVFIGLWRKPRTNKKRGGSLLETHHRVRGLVQLEVDMPAIQRGLLDLIANVFKHLPNAKITSPTRMIQFSQWLAAMEMAQGAPAGAFQDVYCDALKEGQRDALVDNSLAAAVLEFGEGLKDAKWSGTPTDLLNMLNTTVSIGTQRSRVWPENAIALSKRLAPLQTSLRSQGISLELSRGKHRTVTITKIGAGDDTQEAQCQSSTALKAEVDAAECDDVDAATEQQDTSGLGHAPAEPQATQQIAEATEVSSVTVRNTVEKKVQQRKPSKKPWAGADQAFEDKWAKR